MNNQTLQQGDVIGTHFTIIKKLGNGTFGHTYLAQNTQVVGDQNCVVKHLHLNIYDSNGRELCRKLFEREAETLQKLARNNPHIPLLIAYFEENGEFYLVQEYIEGNTLTNELHLGQKLPEDQVIKMLIELLEIVAYLHNNKVIHRDIKPDNIMRRTPDNYLILIDFGAVKQVSSQGQNRGTIIGTQGYMPSEQAMGNTQYSSDIYAIGIIAIQALTGFDPVTISQQIDQEALDLKNQANISNNFAQILTKMVAKNYQDRFPTAQEVLNAIKQIKNSHTSLSTKIASFPTINSFNPRYKIYFIILITLISIISLTLFSLFFINKNSNNYQLLENGNIINGELQNSDNINPLNNSYQDEYLFKGKKGQTIVINLDSEDFDPVLSLYLDKERIALNNDIAPDNFNAEITIILPKNTQYKVAVSSNNQGETGSYNLTAKVR